MFGKQMSLICGTVGRFSGNKAKNSLRGFVTFVLFIFHRPATVVGVNTTERDGRCVIMLTEEKLSVLIGQRNALT